MLERYYRLIEDDAKKPLYDISKQFFGYINKGQEGKAAHDNIFAYNGGLFLPDELLEICTEDKLLNDELLEQQKLVSQAGHKMEDIINSLLLLAKTVKLTDIEMQALDMSEIISQAKKRLAYVISGCQAEIILPDSFPIAKSYAPWVEEIWANYISNAIKYGGYPPKVTLGAAQQDDGIDTGSKTMVKDYLQKHRLNYLHFLPDYIKIVLKDMD